MIDRYQICFLSDRLTNSQLEQSVEKIIQHGLELDPDQLDGTDVSPKQSVQEVLSSNNQNIVSFEYDAYTTVRVWRDPDDTSAWTNPELMLSLSIDGTAGFENEADIVEDRFDILLDVVADIVPVVKPEYSWGMLPHNHEHAVQYQPTERPIVEHIDSLSWVSVFGPTLVADLGGRDRVLSTPAARVEELETGHILVVKTADFFDYNFDGDAIDQYLLEGTPLAEVEAEASTSDSQVSEETIALDDPFRDLEPGDIGADVVVEKDAVGGEISNGDLHLRRVRVDENSHLRDVKTNEFVRRLYGPDGQIGTLPSDITTDEEQFPPLALNGVPVEFVRLTDPDGENVITKCMALDVDVNKFEFLVRLSTSVLDNGYDQADIAATESLLDSIDSLEDQANIDQLIKKK